MAKKFKIPSSTDLIYFMEAANQLNLSRAAESLGISQPSLTLAIQRLETLLGENIIHRHKKGVTLTCTGKQLLIHTRRLIEEWENVKSKTLDSLYEIQGNFTLGCHISLALDVLPRFLPTLLENNPNLEITLYHDLSRKITEKVLTHKVDIGIVANPIKHGDLIIRRLYNDKIKLWSNGKKNKNIDICSGKAILICDPELIQTKVILKKLEKEKFHYGRMLFSNSLEEIAKLTQSGCGIGILPSHVATHYRLKVVDEKIVYQDEICLLYRGEDRNIKSIQVITEAIKKTAW